MAEKWDVEARWPELFESLNEEDRWSLVQTFASMQLAGWEPNREDVADLVDHTRGVITAEEYMQRSLAKAEAVEQSEEER